MRFKKAFVLATSMVAVLTAVVGTGTAPAAPGDTVLCKTTTLPCAGHYPVGTTFHMELATGHKTLKAGFSIIACKKETWAGKVGTATTPAIQVESLSPSDCGESQVVVLKRGTLQIHHEGEHKGDVTITGTEITVGTGGVSCVYGGTITSGITVLGGSPASIVTNEANIPKVAGGFLCANPAKWTAHYKVTTPNPLFISTETL
jgi:hypothetical protein